MSSKSDIRAGGAFVEIWASMTRLDSGLRAAERRMMQFGATVTQISSRMFAGGAAAIGGLTAAASAFANSGADLLAMSQRTGIAVESLSELQDALGTSRISLETFEQTTQSLRQNITEAISGNSELAMSFARVGLSAAQLSQMGAEERIMAVMEAISQIPGPANRANAAMRLLGSGGAAMLPALSQGRAGLDALRTAAREAGRTMSTGEAQAAAELSRSFQTLWASIRRVVEVTGAALAPTIGKAIEFIAGAATGVIRWIEANQGLVQTVAIFAAIVTAVGAVGVALGLVISGIGVALGLFAALLSPVGLVVAAVGALVYVFRNELGAILSSVFGQLNDYFGDVAGSIQAVVSAIGSGDIDGAARILWANLRVIWFRGVAGLHSAWSGVVGWWNGIIDQIAILGSDLWAGFQIAGINAWQAILEAWANGAGMIRGIVAAIGGFALVASLDAALAAAQAAGGDPASVAATARAQALADAQARRDRIAEEARLQGQAGNPALDAANEEVRQAQEALRIARDEAMWTEAMRPGRGARPGATPSPGDDDINRTRTALRGAGTFNAYAVGELASTRIEQMTLDVNRRMEEHLRRILGEMVNNGPAVVG